MLTVIKDDPKYPARGIGKVIEVDRKNLTVTILIEKEFRTTLEDPVESRCRGIGLLSYHQPIPGAEL